LGEGDTSFSSVHDAVFASYEKGVTDEFIEPLVFDARGMEDGDALIFFNFRPDRARQISRAFVCDDFANFERPKYPKLHYCCLTEYATDIPAPVIFPKTFPERVLADYLAELGLKQFHIAETEKYAHVTFFLNGGIEQPKEGEARCLIPSPKVATYDLQPEMSAPEVGEALAEAIRNDEADVYIVNFANCDMVGHTGVLEAAIAAVEAVDTEVGRVVEAIREKGGVALITADHGNAEKMISDDGTGPHTAHTLSPVPLILVNNGESEGCTLANKRGRLADIAPTLIDLMGLEKPEQWTGESLLVRP
jgi:2,3-bisphosphoglycerate-independent phosphoglycerate mutase